jgi:hypothetical protein
MPEIFELGTPKTTPNDADLLPVQQSTGETLPISVGTLLAGVRASIAAVGSNAGSITAGLSPWQLITSNYSASHGDRLRIDAGVADIEITLPAYPSAAGADIYLQRVDNATSNKKISVSANGQKINTKTAIGRFEATYRGQTEILSYLDADVGWLSQLGLVSAGLDISVLNFNGVDGATTFVESTGLTTFTGSGGAALSTTQKNSGTASLFLNSASKFLSSVNAQHTWSVDFTWECWIYPTTIDGSLRAIFGNASGGGSGNAGLFVSVQNNNLIFRHWINGNTNATVSGVVLNTWQKVTAKRIGNTLEIWLNNTKGTDGSTTGTTTITTFAIGIVPNNSGFAANFLGYIDDVTLTRN